MVVKSIIYFIVTFIVCTLVSIILFENFDFIETMGLIENIETIFGREIVVNCTFAITLVITNSILYLLLAVRNNKKGITKNNIIIYILVYIIGTIISTISFWIGIIIAFATAFVNFY